MTARLNEISEKIGTALANSAALADWCDAEFSKNLTVFIGIDDEFSPPPDDYPLIALSNAYRVSAGDGSPPKFVIDWWCGLVIDRKDTENTTSTVGTVLKKDMGFSMLEEFRDLAEGEIRKVKSVGSAIDFSGDVVPTKNYPIYIVSSQIALELPWDRTYSR